ncbi:MAG: tetratricopeptide repeat protein [Endomicrobia bacterium]|nr:tetratricopeptide repeat protein [Endomicrobiia bacterium]MCL2799433.1 tetratricopeptide repeat protein [Endomicrobiia bacterium]
MTAKSFVHKALSKKKIDKNFKISVILTLCFVLACCAVYVIKNKSYSKDVILHKANTHYIKEQYFMAAKYFDKAISLGAEGSEIFRNYAIALLKLGNYDSAIKNLKLSEEIDPYNAETYYSLGNAYYQKAYASNNSDQFIQGIKYLEKAINLSPAMEKAYILIGLSYRNCGMQENARSWYRRALLASNFSKAGFYNLIGHTFREEERYKEAADYYQRAIDNDYSFAAAYCNLGDMYLKMNDKDTAMLKYKKSIAVGPDYIVPYIKIGQIYYDDAYFDDAVFWALQAFRINPDSDKANYLLGMAYKEIGRKIDAVEYLKKAAYCGSDDAVYELKNIGIDLR